MPKENKNLEENPLLVLSELTALSSVDGRYGPRTAKLRRYLSEYALFKYRTFVELEYFKAMCPTVPQLSDFDCTWYFKSFDCIVTDFSVDDASQMKALEKVTNHDVEAVKQFLKDMFDKDDNGYYKEFIHFGLTSYDINSPAVNMMVRDAMNDVILPELDYLISQIFLLAEEWKQIPILAHTHGQPASPTKLGKELEVFVERLSVIRKDISEYVYEAKFGGATGNFNAHYAAYPNIDWHLWANAFLQDAFHLRRQQTTTQIEHYDNLAKLFNLIKSINVVFIDMAADMWSYISMGYFSQKVKTGEVGSSAMPHKVNPIDFENAEGNSGIAIALFEHLSRKLPISRLQRDLTGSTVERVIGMPLAHFLISISALQKAFGKVVPNLKKIDFDLNQNWVVIAEGIQTILRRENYPDAYNALKKLTRTGENELITKDIIHIWIDTELVGVSDKVKKELKKLTPWNYVGK